MSGPAFKDHFSAHSADYAAIRPTYPAELGAYLATEAPGRELALDCGCGNGQLSILLVEHFSHVVATDASAKQIASALQHPRITYRVATAEASGLEPESADLVVAAQAAHWFDLDRFYAEVRRVGKRRALLALVTYGVLHVEGDAEDVIQNFYSKTLAPYWPPERRTVEEGYRSLPFPFPELAAPDLTIERRWNRNQFLTYVDSWSAVKQLEKVGGRRIVDDFARSLAGIWPDGQTLIVRWPMTVRAGHKG